MMTKDQYFQIRKAVQPVISHHITLAVVLADFAIVLMSLAMIKYGGIFPYIFAQVLLGVVYFHNFALLHEAGHGNLHKKGWVNDVVGHYFGILAFLPHFPWKYTHSEHHHWSGMIDDDPSLSAIKKIRAEGKVPVQARFLWWTWLPIGTTYVYSKFWTLPLDLMFGKKKLHQHKFIAIRNSLISVCVAVLSYSLLYYVLNPIIPMWKLIPSFLVYQAITEMINIPHHLGVPSFEKTATQPFLPPWMQNITTRTSLYPFRLGLLVTLNFNLHTEHHFYPKVSWWQLPEIRALIVPVLKDDYQEVSGIDWVLDKRKRKFDELVIRN